MDFKTVIDEWFNANIPSSPVSRDVDALNHLRQRLPDLAARLDAAAKAAAQKGDGE